MGCNWSKMRYIVYICTQSDLKKLVKPKFKFQRGRYFMRHIDGLFYFSKKIWSLFYGTYIVLFQQKKRFLKTCIYTYQKNETFWYVVNYSKYPILVFIHSDSEILLLKTPDNEEGICFSTRFFCFVVEKFETNPLINKIYVPIIWRFRVQILQTRKEELIFIVGCKIQD